MDVIDRFQLEKSLTDESAEAKAQARKIIQLEKSLTDKSAEAEAQARETAEKERRLQEVNQQLQKVNVRIH